MKELVEEVVEKVQLELLNLSQGERQAILQSLYRIVWELKTHEIIGTGGLWQHRYGTSRYSTLE